MTLPEKSSIEITDYDSTGYDYTNFWKGRTYEDRSEKNALQKMLPRKGEKILDAGGGFGRLTPLYIKRYKQAIILDYSQTNLNKAQLLAEQKGWKNLQTYRGNLYQLPFKDHEFDTVLMVRVIHHLKEPQLALQEAARVLEPGGILILEFANKLHLKRRLIYLVQGKGKELKSEKPFKVGSIRSSSIIYNYHPYYIKKLLAESGFVVEKKIAASALRLAILKRFLPLRLHLLLDALLRPLFTALNLSPSLIYRCRKLESG